MPKTSGPAVIIEEWDGDRFSAVGGFNLVVRAGDRSFEEDHGSYDTQDERSKALEKVRKAAAKTAKKLKLPVREKLLIQ